MEEFHGDPIVGPRAHASRSGPEIKDGSSAKNGTPERLRCGIIQEVSYPEIDHRRHCKKNSLLLFCIDKRTNKVVMWQQSRDSSGRTRRGRTSSYESKKSDKRENCEKEFVSRWSSRCALSLQ